MKVAILTQPLHTNFGGTLQAFALQKVLKDMNLEVVTINYRVKDGSNFRKILSIIKHSFKKTNKYPLFSGEIKKIEHFHNNFIKNHIKTSCEINTLDDLKKYFSKNLVDAVIVGSDQVWRLEYSPRIETFFLDFLYDNEKIKKISYAASFGLDEWYYSKDLTNNLQKYINKFDYLSVREDRAIKLCMENLNVIVDQVLDPTLLLNRNDYCSLFNNEKSENVGKIFTYILDENEIKNKIVKKVSNCMNNKKIFKKLPHKKIKTEIFITNISEYKYPSIESWLQSFNDADFIITDSFHGTVFSILFNKQFIAIANRERGESRFTSLLNLLGISERLIYEDEDIDLNLIKKNINYNDINIKVENLRSYSIQWLKNSLDINRDEVL